MVMQYRSHVIQTYRGRNQQTRVRRTYHANNKLAVPPTISPPLYIIEREGFKVDDHLRLPLDHILNIINSRLNTCVVITYNPSEPDSWKFQQFWNRIFLKNQSIISIPMNMDFKAYIDIIFRDTMSDEELNILQSAIAKVGDSDGDTKDSQVINAGFERLSDIMIEVFIHMSDNMQHLKLILLDRFAFNFFNRNQPRPHLLTIMDVLSDESKTTVRILSNLVDNHDVEQLQNIWKHVFGDHENVSSISNLSKIMEGQSLIIYVSFRLYTYEQKQQLENAIEELGHQTTYMVLLRTCLKKMLESNTQGNYLISRSISTPN